MSSFKRVGHYVSSTHWDREWYEPFQDYRYRLVQLMDELLAVMERDPEYRYFQTDGQSIIIEDYLEIRPERTEDIRRLAGEGRLRIGPWYVLPDEFLVSGESLIRNLAMGIRVAEKFGRASRVGFICDMFGHISQLPQIFRGFGIDNAFLWRGCNEPTHGAAFRWQSPDGSEVLAYRFSGFGGYCTFTYDVRKTRDADRYFDPQESLQGLRWVVDHEMKRCPTPSFLLFDGGDHLEIEPGMPELFRRARASGQFEDVEIVHSHLEGFVEDLREQRDRITKTFKGELREPAMTGEETWLITGTLSSRIPLKQSNARCETELCLWAEPWNVFAARLGREYPRRYLEVAWRWLLQNHPHDSMCGCSIDQVHQDMVYRFDQCRLIATRQSRAALEAVAEQVTLPEMGEKDFAVVVFNPTGRAIDGPVDLTLRFPVNLDCDFAEFFGFEPKVGFRLYGPEGGEVPYQFVAQRRDQMSFQRQRAKFPVPDPRHEVDVCVRLQIPPFGYTRLLCRPEKAPTRHLGSMAVNDHTIANEYLEVSVATNGTLTLKDRRNGNVYEKLLTLEDCADIGDGWYHGVASADEVFTSIGCRAQTAMIADGIHRATLRIRVIMEVPAEYLFDRHRRSGSWTPLCVTHHVSLRRGAEYVEVRTEVENVVRDHRLRVLFPSHAQAETYLSDQAFDVVERKIALRPDNARYKELEVETRPQQSWTAVHDQRRGLAIISSGLPEAAVRDLPERPIALTLLRSFIKAVLTSGNEGGEIQGRHTFRYWIAPLSGPPDRTRLFHWGQLLAAGVRSVQVEQNMLRWQARAGGPGRHLPAVHSFLKPVSGDPVVTAIYRQDAGNDELVRMFNPHEEKVQIVLGVDRDVAAVYRADLEGRAGDPLPIRNGQISLPLNAKQIITLRMARKKG